MNANRSARATVGNFYSSKILRTSRGCKALKQGMHLRWHDGCVNVIRTLYGGHEMKKMVYKSVGMAAACGLLLLANVQTAHAGLDCVSVANQCTASVSVAQQATELGTSDSPLSMLLPLFDSTLGTLTGASVTITGTIYSLTGSLVKNISSSNQSFKAKEDEQFNLDDTSAPSGSLETALNAAAFTVLLDPKVSQTYSSLPAGQSAAFGPFTTSGTATLANTGGTAGIPALSLAEMQASGGGNDTLTLSTDTTTSNTGAGGNVQESFLTDGALNISVVYSYTPAVTNAPEPASLTLLGAGLACLGILRRRWNG